MPATIDFSGGDSPAKKVFEITSFRGIDLSSAPADIDKRRSPDAPNMILDSKGNPIKRTGFFLSESYGERINGAFVFGKHLVIHSGSRLFIDGEKVWEGMADELSTGQVIGNKLYIFDGLEALVCDGEDAWPLCDDAYIPTVLISKNADEAEKEIMLKGDGVSTEFVLEDIPAELVSVLSTEGIKEAELSGDKIVFSSAPAENEEITVKAIFKQEPGGEQKEEFNLISSRWKESFICETGTEKIFTLSKNKLSKGKVKAWVMDGKGVFQKKTEGTDFSVDRENGKIIFNSPVSKTPVTGEDNLIIEAAKFFEGYEEKINLCKQSIAFDTGGTANRIFVSGNPNEPRKDYWCAAGDPSYWPDTYYSELGSEGNSIIGYSVIGSSLATYISHPKDGRGIIIRKAHLDEQGNMSFPIEGFLQGEEAIAPRGFVYMDKEQLFLTARGVYAITAEDVSGEKYTQNRSYFINKALCEEQKLENAFCAKWRQFYVIAINGKFYLLDSGQKSYESGEPLSTGQYECYLWTGIPARVLWEQNGQLFFGDEEGNICYFNSDVETAKSYVDYSKEGERPIEAYWTFPDFSGDVFWRNKTIRTVGIQLLPYARNKVRLEVRTKGFWKVLKDFSDRNSYFSWNSFGWEGFTWSGDATYRTATAKVKIKKFDKCGFRISCTEKNKAFGLYGFSVEYTENGRYKR
ncbi:MAG: hypothetical protein E7482_00445 [Ruminococcaceae bacterium]|nr:hypothetical protein [Oscillospiraceae bacterium]